MSMCYHNTYILSLFIHGTPLVPSYVRFGTVIFHLRPCCLWLMLLGLKLSQSKEEVCLEIDSENVKVEEANLLMNQSEPWTILAHKKPQKAWIPYNPRTMRRPPLARNTKSVKLISWNVNGLRALLKLEGFSALQLAQKENFDILCLQETKLQVSTNPYFSSFCS